ncbi:ABC transporter ATP-binding protein, partial [Streptomyces sp. NPDC049881]
LAEVFGVSAVAERHADGVVRISYAADPLAREAGAVPGP